MVEEIEFDAIITAIKDCLVFKMFLFVFSTLANLLLILIQRLSFHIQWKSPKRPKVIFPLKSLGSLAFITIAGIIFSIKDHRY